MRKEMKQSRKDEIEKSERLSIARRYLSDGFNALMDKLDQKGFDQMVNEGFVIRTETDYQV